MKHIVETGRKERKSRRHGSGFLCMLMGLCLATASCSHQHETAKRQTGAEESTENAMYAGGGAQTSVPQASASEVSSEEAALHPVGSRNDDYFLPDAASYVYQESALRRLTAEELRLARNEIYARHGRMFTSADLSAYFQQKSWYKGSISAADFDETVLTEAERENIRLLQRLEGEQIPISAPQIAATDFPVIDGSTATLPISQALYQLCTGASAEEAARRIVHNKTSQSYHNLAIASEQEREERRSWAPRLVIAYEASDEVQAELKAEGEPLLIKPIGRDALVFLCNSQNPVRSLTEGQLADIYAGVLTNWKDVGGTSAPIEAFQRPEGSGSQTLMEKLVMRGRTMAAAPASYVLTEMGELLDKVAAYDNSGNALGYSVYYYARNMYQRPNLRFLSVNGVAPTSETIRDGSYPYGNAFYAAIRKDEPADSAARQLFDWLTTDEGQALINGLGYVGERDTARKLPDALKDAAAGTNAPQDSGTENKRRGDESGSSAEAKSDAAHQKDLPLAADEVLLADGGLLYGEEGLAVLDKEGTLVQFLPDLRLTEEAPSFMQHKREELLPLQNGAMSAGEPVYFFPYGLYSLAENRWVVAPVYDRIAPIEEGFACFCYDEEQEAEDASYDEALERYTILDRQGKQLYVGAKAKQRYQEATGSAPFYGESGKAALIEEHPEILQENNATEAQLFFDYPLAFGETFAYLEFPDRLVYYDLNGKHLFTYDKTKESTEAPVRRAYRVSQKTCALHIWQEDSEQLAIYQNGKLKKWLDSRTMDEGESLGSVIVGDDFYAVSSGNYIYLYTYQDALCMSFLSGWSRTD